MRKVYTINSNSSTIQNSDISHLKVNLPRPIVLGGNPDDYSVVLEYMRLPYTVYNISSAKANNKISYNYDSTDYEIEFSDGIYTANYLKSYVDAYQLAQSHYDTNSYGVKTYYWTLDLNSALGKFYVQVNKVGTTVTFPNTTFYNVIGFTSDASITETTLGTSIADITQGTEEIYLWCNIVSNTVNSTINSNILYNSVWSSKFWSCNVFPRVEEKLPPMAGINTTTISNFEFKLLDKDGNNLNFADNGTIDSITIRISIMDSK